MSASEDGLGAWPNGHHAEAAIPEQTPHPSELSDFTVTTRVITISLIALVIGVISAFIALLLLRMIYFVTDLLYFGDISLTFKSPADNTIGALAIGVPVIGGIIVGVMARYGSDKIRGHGIPEAIESILLNGSRIGPLVALLKPVSSAIAIGTGGPFGAEGPIIMTGGAVGSLIAQFIHLTSSERKTLLVAGAAGGMAAIFAAPVSAVLLAVELLLFEWKPRSLVPVAVASVTSMAVRHALLGPGPLFPTPPVPSFIGALGLLGCVAVGLVGGALAYVLTEFVYGSEEFFDKLPIHWMWWPALGGIVVGVGGLIQPRALGVGYDVIADLINGHILGMALLSIMLVKGVIWAIALGSGTSGGVLAPLLIVGAALGGIEAHILPAESIGFWAIISMAAVLGAALNSPLTAIVFVIEITHDVNLLVPLLAGVMAAYAFSVLTMKRSILTEKISRRGYHLSREYTVDPLEFLFVREVMNSHVIALPASAGPTDLRERFPEGETGPQRLYPVVDAEDRLLGVVTGAQIEQFLHGQPPAKPGTTVCELMLHPFVAFPGETLRSVVQRMAETGLTRFPVVEPGDNRRLLGIVSLYAVLQARVRALEAERRRERVLPLRIFFPFGAAAQSTVNRTEPPAPTQRPAARDEHITRKE
ncbi:MAG TPA: chloride channel protein [Thermomicrobiaceae bacterium]|nr:chloride channel protein [Thermomicrobiaceae bacterium]